MIKAGMIAMSILATVLTAPLIQAQDLSRYRGFQFGMDLPAAAKQARVKLSDAKVIHQRPAMIQELVWEAPSLSYSSPGSESVRDILFSFYNGELFRMVVNYDRERTEGMTAEDLIEAISVKYGASSRPAAEIVISSTQLFEDSEKVHYNRVEKIIARWEDAQYSVNLFLSSSQATYGLVVYSKRVDALAQVSMVEAIRMDEQEAPQRELSRQKKKADENRVQQDKARRSNKRPFRP